MLYNVQNDFNTVLNRNSNFKLLFFPPLRISKDCWILGNQKKKQKTKGQHSKDKKSIIEKTNNSKISFVVIIEGKSSVSKWL